MPKMYERARVRPLSVEELIPSLRVATGYNPDWAKAGGDFSDYYLRYFGEPNDGQGQFPKSAREGFSMNGVLAQADPMLAQDNVTLDLCWRRAEGTTARLPVGPVIHIGLSGGGQPVGIG